MRPLVVVPLIAALWFPFAETPQPPKEPRGSTITIPMSPSPVEIERRCMQSEKKLCRDACGQVGGLSNSDSGWNPNTAQAFPLEQSACGDEADSCQVMSGCDVRTVGGVLSLICSCTDPGLRT